MPKELSDALIELSVATQRRAMYPGGHPTLASAERRLLARFEPLLATHEMLTIGVARDQLVVEGTPTDGRQPLLRAFAERLHGHRIAAVQLSAGLRGDELADFLGRIARDPATHDGEPLTAPTEVPPTWTHLRVFRQSYERLELAAEDDPSAMPRADQLWLALAKAAINPGGFGEPGTGETDMDPAEMARAINARAHDDAYEKTVMTYLLQIVGEMRRSEAALHAAATAGSDAPPASPGARRVSGYVGVVRSPTPDPAAASPGASPDAGSPGTGAASPFGAGVGPGTAIGAVHSTNGATNGAVAAPVTAAGAASTGTPVAGAPAAASVPAAPGVPARRSVPVVLTPAGAASAGAASAGATPPGAVPPGTAPTAVAPSEGAAPWGGGVAGPGSGLVGESPEALASGGGQTIGAGDGPGGPGGEAGPGGPSAVLRGRVSRLVTALSPDAVDRLLQMGGTLGQQRSFLLDATSGLAIDAVLALTLAAARVTKRAISQPLLRLLVKLAGHAERGRPAMRQAADAAVREHVREMIDGWTLPDPAPGQYGAILDRMARPVERVASESGITQWCEPERVLELSLELRNAAPPLWDAIDTLVARGEIHRVLDALDTLADDDPIRAIVRTKLSSVEYFRALLTAPAITVGRIEAFARKIGDPATDALLDALADADNRAARRRLLDVLSVLGESVAPRVVARLPGAPWYVQRNLLLLMSGMPHWPAGFTPATYAGHADARVRREALRVLLKRSETRTVGIIAAVGDSDPQLVRIGLDAALRDCPAAAVTRIVQRLDAETMPPELHVPALQALAGSGAQSALACLLSTATSYTRWFKRLRVAPRSAQVLAALTGLATYWADEPRAAALLARATTHSDPVIRAAARPAQPAPATDAEPPTMVRDLGARGPGGAAA